MSSRDNLDHYGLRWSLVDKAGYQFSVTGMPHRIIFPPNLTFADGVYVPWPDPRKKQTWDDVIPIPTGAMIREDKVDPENPRWPFFKISTTLDYSAAAHLLWKTNIGFQVDGAPPQETYRYRLVSNDADQGPQYASSRPIYTSIASNEGQIRMAGVFMPAYGFTTGDIQYDRAPTSQDMGVNSVSINIKKKTFKKKGIISQASDADWYHDATIIKVFVREIKREIPFVVMVDAKSLFHAWPLNTDLQPDLSSSENRYYNQSIKTNIHEDRVERCFPFKGGQPDWVYTYNVVHREFYESEGHQSFFPRYVWRFHPFENKVVGMCLKRTEPNYDVLKKVEDSWPETFIKDGELSPASVYAKRKVSNDKEDTTLYPMMEDIPGFVEFRFTIEVDPPKEGELFNEKTFNFKLEMVPERDELAAETNYPIAAAYLNPVQGSWRDRQVEAEPGDLLVAYLRLYEHPKYRQNDITILQTGEPSFIQYRFSRTYMDIKNISRNILLKTVPLMINDDFYGRAPTDHNGTVESATIRTATLGRIEQLQLEEFSWLIRYEKTKISPIKDSEFTVQPYPRYPDPLSSGVIYSNHPNHGNPSPQYPYPIDDIGIVFGSESEIGIRFVHRNVVCKQEEYGVQLGIWSTVDHSDVSGNPLLLESKRLLLYPTDGLSEHGNRLFDMLYHAYLMCEVFEGDPAEWSDVTKTFSRMFLLGFIENMAKSFGEEWKDEWVEDILKPFCVSAMEEWVPREQRGSTLVHHRIDRTIVTGLHPGDFFYQIPGYSYAPYKKNRIESFNDGIHGYLRAWQFMFGESFHQYFHTGPDGSFSIFMSIPHINSTRTYLDPIKKIHVPPAPTKPYPVGVGFFRHGWVTYKTVNTVGPMNDRSFLYELITEIKKHEPDMGRPFQEFTDRTLTIEFIDLIGFEKGSHPRTTHIELYKRAYQLKDEEMDITKFYMQPRLLVRWYSQGVPVIGIDSVIYTKDVTPEGVFLNERYRVSNPPGLSTIPGLKLYEGNDYDIDTPRYNAGMHGVGSYLTGWHEYPK